ncbi:response regulator [Rickettsia endosymbiont of Cardiosporidium cionae]|uniref:response regulator n=1 Tax=Rickettsia endosymbiont of Cardiosporidium cionae TaxID=2777155 RepID=UPI00189620DC|nr:response regulator [Rickettsia endosymbiont of Cardiosporidium cionae]KAF8818672.1 PleD family two-component system response regulator [Rickettsia endosymbiont of Cardiosporidium cionae]
MQKVLVVEDDKLNYKLFYDLLAIKHCAVILSQDGYEIVDFVKKEKPSLILMDIQLKVVSGITLIKSLKSDIITQNIPIVAVSASGIQQDKELVMKTGCEIYLAKPFDISDFYNIINMFIR